MSLLGGIAGAFAGVVVAVAIGALAGWPVVIDVSSMLLAIGFAAGVGVCFGYYPARRAARLQPVAALRTE